MRLVIAVGGESAPRSYHRPPAFSRVAGLWQIVQAQATVALPVPGLWSGRVRSMPAPAPPRSAHTCA